MHIKTVCKGLYQHAYKRAKKKNLPFNITQKYIETIFSVDNKCPILRYSFKTNVQGGNKFSPTLDKIDPSKGYIKGNVRVISMLANNMLSNSTKEELNRFKNYLVEGGY